MISLPLSRPTLRPLLSLLLLTVTAGLLSACSASYEVQTPEEMVAVEQGNHSYVAMTHDGVVVRANVYSQGDGSRDLPRGSQRFWVESARERMRTTGGYALLDEKEARSANGVVGTRLEFGRDQQGVPYRYWIILFVTDDAIHVIDAGGRQERFDDAKDAVERLLSSYVVLK